MPADEFLFAQARQAFVSAHACPDCLVIDGDVVNSLIPHATRDQLLGFFDRLNKFAWRQSELLGAQARRRLCLGSSDCWGEDDRQRTGTDHSLHDCILSKACSPCPACVMTSLVI